MDFLLDHIATLTIVVVIGLMASILTMCALATLYMLQGGSLLDIWDEFL